MHNRRTGNKISIIIFFNMVFLIQIAQAHAADEYRVQYVPVVISGVEYYYSDGSFYRRFGDVYLTAPAPIGAVVRTIPRDYKPIIIDGVAYYIVHGSVYMQTLNGYQVMPQKPFMIEKYADEQKNMIIISPQVTPNNQQPAMANAEEPFTVNIPNSTGGYTPVAIKKSGDGFIGPQGEYYQEFPRVEQLKTKYAK
jgi:hypothetical protein